MNKRREFKKIAKEGKKAVFLTEQEKGVMRSSLLDFMKQHPLQEMETPSQVSWFASVNFTRPVVRYATMLSVLSFVIIYGVSFAATKALPGDVLYPVKTEVNERVLGFLKVSDESRAEYDIQLAETRLEEIEKVSSSENLDEIRNNVSVLLNKHIESAQKYSDKIKGNNKEAVSAQINSELEASLKAHKEILSEISEKNKETVSMTIQNVLLNVDQKITGAEKKRQVSETDLSNRSSSAVRKSAEAKLVLVQKSINETEALLENKKSSLSEEAYIIADANIDLAKETVKRGKEQMEEKNYSDAFSIFQKAMRIIQETQISIQASVKLKINVPKEYGQRNEDNDSWKNNDRWNQKGQDSNDEKDLDTDGGFKSLIKGKLW